MRVTVISVNQEEAVLVRGTSALGVRGTFGCPLVVGDVIYIASRGFEDNLRSGNSIEVETGFESLSDIETLFDDTAELMEPVGEPGDYLIHGRVVSSVVGGDARVAVRGFFFRIDHQELQGQTLEAGTRVRFKVHRLHFWDTAS